MPKYLQPPQPLFWNPWIQIWILSHGISKTWLVRFWRHLLLWKFQIEIKVWKL